MEGDGAEEPSSALPYVASLSRLLATPPMAPLPLGPSKLAKPPPFGTERKLRSKGAICSPPTSLPPACTQQKPHFSRLQPRCYVRNEQRVFLVVLLSRVGMR